MTSLTILATIMFLPALVIVLAIVWRRQMRERARATVAPCSLASADYLAGRVQRRAVLTLVGIAAGSDLAMHDQLIVPIVMLFPLLAWVAIGAVVRIVVARRALSMLALGDAVAKARYDQVDVIAGGCRAVVRTSPRLVQRAMAHGVPGASFRRVS